MQASVDNAVNDLHYEVKFENCVKDKINCFIKQNISFLNRREIFFKIPKNLIASGRYLKTIDMLGKRLNICWLPKRISNVASKGWKTGHVIKTGPTEKFL